MSDKVTLKIPRDLYQTLSEMISGTGFSSVTEFSVFVLRSIATKGEGSINDIEGLTGTEINAVRERLEKLGYLSGGK
ncbi:hypothetical protein [Methanogenium organophilum]|uniref:CopG family transcriptional regulator n=1 Tax=Methanogenium organophilum TaxID=2199 RepID=A0A9X9S3H0_METOG|nr:hypothetical protein [Methanogenium organophilum]WAI01219.1 hypothetical protein OU421_12520 [Methanogenium organophilum]